jgi:hypothetical protein
MEINEGNEWVNKSVANPDPGSRAFFRLGIRTRDQDEKKPDQRYEIRNPG